MHGDEEMSIADVADYILAVAHYAGPSFWLV
jgi:hypothetical protein